MAAHAIPPAAPERDAHIVVRDLDMAFGDFVLMRNLSFTIRRADVFVIMGGSGCGKSTLMRTMVGLLEPARGEVLYEGQSFTTAAPADREAFAATAAEATAGSAETLPAEWLDEASSPAAVSAGAAQLRSAWNDVSYD